MAPKVHEVSTAPLADFFWIAGLDSQQLLEAYVRHGETQTSNNGVQVHAVDLTIREDVEPENDSSSILESPRPTSQTGNRDSYQHLSRLSNEARNSIRTLDSKSSHSSATIRAVPRSESRISTALNNADFDKAIAKFTADRDSFFHELSFSAGAVLAPTAPSKPRPRTQKIVPEELDQVPNRTMGSIRRLRDLGSIRRKPSMARHTSVRTSRRASNYNSVIPAPEALSASPNLHPLKCKFAPVLLDRYPAPTSKEESDQRGGFPNYVPMFAFPNDIGVVSADKQPRSTWHGFSMTGATGVRLSAICIIVWIPMSQKIAAELEARCEEWRRSNMTEAELELAASLAQRLILEREKLSALLFRLPQAPSGSDDRDRLEDEIGAVEEKINVMADMLKPLRHGAASKIEGLTESGTGIWIPRAYGILGRDASLMTFWKEWLRAVVVPMSDGAILRVPASSPKIGMWQPLERYVMTLCTEAPSPTSSKTQVEIAIRELRTFARKEAQNELPGSRNTDIYPLFRALSIPNIMVLFEYLLAESRIILLSSHTSMLQLVGRALIDLLWPLQWAHVYIPVLPARLIQVLDAPCPYICGVERRYEKLDLPEDFVLVDLDTDEIQSTSQPHSIPRQLRRKLASLLQLAAPHHNKHGVPIGPPCYAVESFPFDMFSSEHSATYTSNAARTNLAKFVSLTSTSFGDQAAAGEPRQRLIFNAFSQAANTRARSSDRPKTASTSRNSNFDSPDTSPITTNFPPLPLTPVSRNESGYALKASLREQRSGHFTTDPFKHVASYGSNTIRRPSLPFTSHSSSGSTVTANGDPRGVTSNYAPSTYAQSTLAASTIMPGMLLQPVKNTESTSWVEGHCIQWRPNDGSTACSICEEKAEDGHYRCIGCGATVHGRCAPQITVVCPAAFYPDQIRAAFARFFASLLYTYKKYMQSPSAEQKRSGLAYSFNMDEFVRSLPGDHGDYMNFLRETQAFNEFISEREVLAAASPVALQDSIKLFDAIILAKRNRGGLRSTISLGKKPFTKQSPSANVDFLSDTTEHLWRTATVTSTSDRVNFGSAAQGRDYHTIVTRKPSKLEEGLMPEPKMNQGVPRITEKMRQSHITRKGIPNGKSEGPTVKQRMNGLRMNAPEW